MNIALILLVAFFLRIYNIGFPFFTADEARIAFRGYTLATGGIDELGRPFPVLFNSLADYQLPAVSYITAFGEILFGKTDFGARIPFILIGVLLVFLVYKIAQIYSPKKEYWLFSALIAAFSPALVFYSKFPNEMIVLVLSLILLLYLLIKRKINYLILTLTILFTLLIAKTAWWILIPFVVLTIRRRNIFLLALSLFIFAIGLFWLVPQSGRSLLENDFRIFQDITIRNAIETLRAQGVEAGWSPILERALFNKLYLVIAGVLHLLSHLAPNILFGSFDTSSAFGPVSMGAFPKTVIIPFVLGIIFGIRKALFWYVLIVTFPLIFMYPTAQINIVVLALPFISLIIAYGVFSTHKILRFLIIILMVFEVMINFAFPSLEIKNTSEIRPNWIKDISLEAYDFSLKDNVALSDDITVDIAAFLQWYTPLEAKVDFTHIRFPYKFRISKVLNIKIIGSDNTFYNCGLDKPTFIFASKRDLQKIQKWLNINIKETLIKIYKDDLGGDRVYLLRPTICVN